jgi:hypothetical protein
VLFVRLQSNEPSLRGPAGCDFAADLDRAEQVVWIFWKYGKDGFGGAIDSLVANRDAPNRWARKPAD